MKKVDSFNPALFDRTAEQRATHARHTLGLYAMMPDASAGVISQKADTIMQREFLQELDRFAISRAEAPVVNDPELPLPKLDLEARRVHFLNELREEIAELHEALPMPMLDRSEAS